MIHQSQRTRLERKLLTVVDAADVVDGEVVVEVEVEGAEVDVAHDHTKDRDEEDGDSKITACSRNNISILRAKITGCRSIQETVTTVWDRGCYLQA